MAGKGFIGEVKMLMEIDSVWKWNIWKASIILAMVLN